MRFVRSFLLGFLLILLSSLIMMKVRGSESGLYVFAINMMLISLWGIIVLWSKGTGKNRLIRLVILTSLLLSIGTLGVIALVFRDFDVVAWIVVWFLVFYFGIYCPSVYRAKKMKERSGEQGTYPPTDVKYFWFYQWLTAFVFGVLPFHESVKIFFLLLPGLVGGYLIILGLTGAKKVQVIA